MKTAVYTIKVVDEKEAIAVGIIHTAEEIAMTLILPQWTHDVLSIVHALSTAPILLKRRGCC